MIKFELPLKPVTKKNHSRVIPMGGFYKVLPSEQYIKFEKDSQPYFIRVRNTVGVINYPVNIKCYFFMDARRKVDLCNLLNAVDDAMVKSGLILDDNRDIIAAHDGSRVFADKNNPRIEITITEMEDYEQWKNTKDVQKGLFE